MMDQRGSKRVGVYVYEKSTVIVNNYESNQQDATI